MPGVDLEAIAENLVRVAVVRIVVVTLGLFVFSIYSQIRVESSSRFANVQFVLIVAVYVVSILYALVLKFSGSERTLLLAYTQIALDAVIVSVLVLMTGGVESVFTFAYFFTSLGASMTLYRRGAIMATTASLVGFAATVILQVNSVLPLMPAVRADRAWFTFFMSSLGLTLVAALSSTLTERLRFIDQRLTEKKIDFERLEQLHAAILQSLPAGLMTVDTYGVIQYANDSALNILRMEWEELSGKSLWIAVPAMEEAWRGRKGVFERSSLSRFEESFHRSDGTVIRMGFSFAPLTLGQGPSVGTIVVFQDVTHIVRLKGAVERAERLATVGKFAAGLAHEVRNPLASMCASIDVLGEALNPPPAMEKLMANVVKEADRLNALITDFLALAKPRVLELKRCDLATLAEGVAALFKHDKLMASCELETSIETGLDVELDEDRMRQVVWNLCRNAAEAMSAKGGTLAIETRREQGEYVLAIRDTGAGVSKEHLRRIFDPFYTTKAGGSGLGLAIAHSIVEAHGAKMTFESVEGEGTMVRICFPMDDQPMALSSGAGQSALTSVDLS